MDVRERNWIGGEWVPGSGTELLSLNPATGEILWQGQQASASDVDAATQAAQQAGKVWSRRPLEERVAVLHAFQEQVRQHAEELAVVISREVGKPLWDARSEVQAMLGKIPLTIQALAERRPEQQVEVGAALGLTRFKPHGVLAVFGPFNFPGHISNGHIAPALLAGNAVIFKPSELTPHVGEFLVRLWQAAGLPPGTLNLLQGSRETGIELVNHPGHQGVLFTGSYQAGVSIVRALAERPEAIVALELGGNNPLIVHELDNIEAAVYATLQSAFLTGGQRCTCARRLIVVEGNDEFIIRLDETLAHLHVDLPDEDPQPFMGPLIHAAAAQKVLSEQQRLKEAGGSVLVTAVELSLGPAFVTPALIDVTQVQDRSDEEVFGPLLQVIQVPDLAAAIEEANRTRYGLVAGLLSTSREAFEQFYQEVNAGLINWNLPTTGASGQLPFGGTGRSGNHRPAGYFMVDSCNIPIASMQRPDLVLPETLLPGVNLL